MRASTMKAGRMAAALAVAVALAGALGATAAGGSAGVASSLKGSSCAHPYEVHWGKLSHILIYTGLIGDTHYITRTKRVVRRKHIVANQPGNTHFVYSWHGLNGAHMCQFHVWETVRYRINGGEQLGGWVVRQTLIDSHNPSGGTNVTVPVREYTSAEALAIGENEWHEVLTAAR